MDKSESKTLKHANYAESWYRTWCPYCDTDNWYCNGFELDLSSLDVEAIKCRSCKKVFRLGPPDEIMDEINGDDYEFNTKDGIQLIITDA